MVAPAVLDDLAVVVPIAQVAEEAVVVLIVQVAVVVAELQIDQIVNRTLPTMNLVQVVFLIRNHVKPAKLAHQTVKNLKIANMVKVNAAMLEDLSLKRRALPKVHQSLLVNFQQNQR